MVFVFESCCFATIFTLGLRGLGRHTKRGGSFLVAAISGGMVFPPMMGAVVTARNAHVALAIPMMGYILVGSGQLFVVVLDTNICRLGLFPSMLTSSREIRWIPTEPRLLVLLGLLRRNLSLRGMLVMWRARRRLWSIRSDGLWFCGRVVVRLGDGHLCPDNLIGYNLYSVLPI